MNLNKRIIRTMVVILSLFLVLVVYLNWFTIFGSEKYVTSEHNHRKKAVLRGTITDRNGEVLAKSTGEANAQERIYPYGGLYAHTIGFVNNSKVIKTVLEREYDSTLTKAPSIFNYTSEEELVARGTDIQLTLDHGLTEYAAKLLNGKKGSVVVLNPTTGEVYCMYSNPTFDPNEKALNENWDNKVEFFAAAMGGYVPGSTFKVIMAAAAIDNGKGDFEVEDETGKTLIGGKEFVNSSGKGYGDTDLRKAIIKSSNVYFTELSQELGKDAMKEAMDKFYITKKIPLKGIETKSAGLDLDIESYDRAKLASTAFGQGDLSITPLHMALATAAIANDGVMMTPYLVEKTSKGEYTAPDTLTTACSEHAARLVRSYMVDCVEEGTGSTARIQGYKFGGKTGTAETGGNQKDHAWFVGFAPAKNPQIAFCVMIENGGFGASACGPIVKNIVSYCRENGLITK